jgi:ribose transport system permease protein
MSTHTETSTPAPGGTATARTVVGWLGRQPALPAFAGAFVVWLAASAVAGRGTFATLRSGAEVATFLVLVGIGQMFVITVGGIDLSVPYVMTLSAYLTSSVMAGHNGGLVPAVFIALAVGLGTSLVNAALIELLSMPPIVATLAVGFMVDTEVLVRSTSSQGTPSPALVSFVTDTVGSIPVIVIFGVAVAAVFTWVLHRTAFGRSVQAVGQSRTAARLAGIATRRTTVAAYVLCGLAASLTGLLLAGYAGGPSIDMATSYQLESIAVVVLGGSLIAGGRSNVPGVWAGALLLTLLIILVDVANLGAGLEDIVEGALIVAVLVASGGRRAAER